MRTMAIGASTFLAGKAIAKLVQGDFLELANTLPRDAKFLTNLSEGLGLLSAEPKA